MLIRGCEAQCNGKTSEGERYANKGVRSTIQWKDKSLAMTVTRGIPLGFITGKDNHEGKTFRVHYRE